MAASIQCWGQNLVLGSKADSKQEDEDDDEVLVTGRALEEDTVHSLAKVSDPLRPVVCAGIEEFASSSLQQHPPVDDDLLPSFCKLGGGGVDVKK